MKKRETKKTVLWAATDMALSVAAMAAAFFIRFVLFRGENPVGGFGYHMLWAGLFSPVYAVLFGLLGIYEPQPQRGFIHEFGNIVLGCTFGVMLYIDLIFVFRVVDFSRWMILLCCSSRSPARAALLRTVCSAGSTAPEMGCAALSSSATAHRRANVCAA